MEIALQIFDRVFALIVPKKVRLLNEMKRLDEIIKNEDDEKLKKLHQLRRKAVSFQYESGIKAKIEDIDSLIEIYNFSPKIQWFQMRDAYRIWKCENGKIKTEISESKKTFGSFLFITSFIIFGIGGLCGFFVSYWEKRYDVSDFFLGAVFCFAVGMSGMYISILFQEAKIIEKLIEEELEKTLVSE